MSLDLITTIKTNNKKVKIPETKNEAFLNIRRQIHKDAKINILQIKAERKKELYSRASEKVITNKRLEYIKYYLDEAYNELERTIGISKKGLSKEQIIKELIPVIIKESHGNNDVVSEKDAVGYTQITSIAKKEALKYLKNYPRSLNRRVPLDNCILGIIYLKFCIPKEFKANKVANNCIFDKIDNFYLFRYNGSFDGLNNKLKAYKKTIGRNGEGKFYIKWDDFASFIGKQNGTDGKPEYKFTEYYQIRRRVWFKDSKVLDYVETINELEKLNYQERGIPNYRYIIKGNDTFIKILKKFGVDLSFTEKIKNFNKGFGNNNLTDIKPGETIYIPKKETNFYS